jgi:RNA polymerase sigma-70 factor (ECF subfamily)
LFSNESVPTLHKRELAMQSTQEIGTFQRDSAEVPHSRVADAPTEAAVDDLAAQEMAQADELGPLVQQAKAGDRTALGALLATVRPRAMAAAMKVLRNADDAEDAVQEAFVKIWRSFRGFEGRSAFASWVHRIVVNASLDLLRRSEVRCENHGPAGSQPAAVDGAGAPEPADERTPETDLAALETQMLVRAAISRLPVLHRQAVELRELEDCSYQEMADLIDCPIGTVMSRLHHARHRLTADLSQAFAGSHALAA